jgi:hypothetical protein
MTAAPVIEALDEIERRDPRLGLRLCMSARSREVNWDAEGCNGSVASENWTPIRIPISGDGQVANRIASS